MCEGACLRRLFSLPWAVRVFSRLLRITRAPASWPRGEAFDVQQFYALQSLVNLDLYRANPQTAWKRIVDTWPQVRGSGRLRLTLMQTFLEDARARVALALAGVSEGSERRRWMGIAERASRMLLRSKAAYAPGLGHLLAAGIAILNDDRAKTKAHLQDAEAIFARNELIPCWR